jgi:hypothetical protein
MKKFILLSALIFFCFKFVNAQYEEIDPLHPTYSMNSIVAAALEPGSSSTLPDVKYHLTAKPWQALDISKNNYLDRVEGIVREIVKFQNSTGAIIDPYANREIQYATPYFANAVGTLISAGRAADLLGKGVAAMNSATLDIEEGRQYIPDTHGEFFLAPLASAIPIYTPFVSSLQVSLWKKRMANSVTNIIRGNVQNWRTYAMKGEWYRAKNGYVNYDSAVKWIENSWIQTQRSRLTNNSWNFYHDETSDPDAWPYESVGRANLLALVADGYSGASRDEILSLLKKGTQSILLLQDPTGQGVAGGRSGNHTWNDILLANGYETMAELAYQEGNVALAGQYRHAAALAFQSVQRWRRSDGTYSVTKNHFNPKDKIGYASYSAFTNYNGNMMFHMAENYLRHKTAIPEQPSPNEIGGYTVLTDNAFSTAVANAGGMHMEVCLKGSTELSHNVYWTTLGVARFAKSGWDSRLGPSDGVRSAADKFGASFAPTFLENGNWLRLASVPDRYEAFFTTQFTHPLLVRCRVEYKPKSGKTGPTFTNDFIITPDGVLSTLTSTSTNFGITWPVLTFDGATNLKTNLSANIASTSFPDGTDEQNFIAIHSSPVITKDAIIRSAYGDLSPMRMVSGQANNVTLVYPRNSEDPSAESVRQSFRRSGNDFSTLLGKVKGDIYIGRTSAGGVAQSIDLDDDSTPEATFSSSTGFFIQLNVGEITKIEADRDVTATIYGHILDLKAYTPRSVNNPRRLNISKVLASADDGENVAANTLDRDYNTRWAAKGENQWIRFYLDTIAVIKTVKIAWYKGNQKRASFDLQVSLDSTNWVTIFSGNSSGNTDAFESYNISTPIARYIRIVGHGNNIDLWNEVSEVELLKEAIPLQTLNTSAPLTIATGQMARAQASPDKELYPRSTYSDGTIKKVPGTDWTSGNFPGSLWLIYEYTKDTVWRKRAEEWSMGVERQKYNTSSHDAGWTLFSSFGEGYRLTGNKKYKTILLQGAKTLATRFNDTVGCIKSFTSAKFNYPVMIEGMLTIEILFWATKVSGDSSFYKMAVKHALTTMANHFRANNSSYHLIDYDSSKGSVIKKVTFKGLSDSSDWARGQAMGLYGFTMCYRETRDARFLKTAQKIADFYITHPKMPADLIPFWDFDASDYRDVSAAAIASAALLELSQYAPDKASAYYNFGVKILQSLSSSTYLASVATNNDFVLKHGVGNKRSNEEINAPLCYADYYFIKALLRYKKPASILTGTGGNSQISLKWNVSTGALFYSIQRSTASGGPYRTIISNITDTTYTDEGLASAKTFFYRVISWNIIGPGGTSAEATATTNLPLEAEEAVLSGAVTASNQSGFTGAGFANYVNASGDFIEWTVNLQPSETGAYVLKFRYANAGGKAPAINRPLELKVNGRKLNAALNFYPTGGWTIWTISSTTANLIAGQNKVRLTTIGASGPNIDNLSIARNKGILEAEEATLSGAGVASNQAGFTGTGFADYANSSGDFIEWTVNLQSSNAGEYILKFRYANGGGSTPAINRPLKLTVNGTMINANLDFQPTGGWTTWSSSSATAKLIDGENKIRLTTTGAGGPNIDNLTLIADPLVLEKSDLFMTSKQETHNTNTAMNRFESIKVFPNPLNNTLNIYTTGMQKNKPLTMSVISSLGVIVIKQSTVVTDVIRINVSHLASGVYTLRVISNDKLSYRQFIKF